MSGPADSTGGPGGPGGPGDQGPVLRVIRGDATPEEIAAVLAVVAARGRVVAAGRADPEGTTVWSAPEQAHRALAPRLRSGRHGWRTSYWPR